MAEEGNQEHLLSWQNQRASYFWAIQTLLSECEFQTPATAQPLCPAWKKEPCIYPFLYDIDVNVIVCFSKDPKY